jgi:hypothetical protein
MAVGRWYSRTCLPVLTPPKTEMLTPPNTPKLILCGIILAGAALLAYAVFHRSPIKERLTFHSTMTNSGGHPILTFYLTNCSGSTFRLEQPPYVQVERANGIIITSLGDSWHDLQGSDLGQGILKSNQVAMLPFDAILQDSVRVRVFMQDVAEDAGLPRKVVARLVRMVLPKAPINLNKPSDWRTRLWRAGFIDGQLHREVKTPCVELKPQQAQ